MNSGAAASPRSRRALRPVHWRSRIVIAGKRCEISKALRQRSSAIRFPAFQHSIGGNGNGVTDEVINGVQLAATCIVATSGLASRNSALSQAAIATRRGTRPAAEAASPNYRRSIGSMDGNTGRSEGATAEKAVPFPCAVIIAS
jgi:hypothetical protein